MATNPYELALPPLILVIDNEVLHLRMLSIILGKEYSVLTASNSAEALHLLEELQTSHQINSLFAIFLDIVMPDVDGLELLDAIHARHPDVPILMCSGINQKEIVLDSIARGAVDYILKPYQPKSISQKLQSLRARTAKLNHRSA